MQPIAGARLGLVAGLAGLTALACASSWKPPPEPPPPIPYADAPSKYNPFRGLEWTAFARTIGCGPVDLTVPVELAAHVQMNGSRELTIVPPGAPPGGALMARVHADAPEPPYRSGGFFDPLVWSIEAFVDHATLGHEFEAMTRLHEMASGHKLDRNDKLHAEAKMNDDLLEVDYTIGDAGGEAWRLVGLDGEICSVIIIERVRPDGTRHFADIDKQLRAAALSFKLARF